MIAFLRRRPGLLPLLLLAPAIAWLVAFYVYPAIQMLQASLWSGTLETGFAFSWANAATYPEALGRYSDQFLRSILYAAVSTVVCLALAFPLAYTIAYRAGRFRTLLLFIVIAPFFTSFLLRVLAWKTVLGDDGFLLGPLKSIGLLPEEFRILATPIAVIFGISYNFFPFMVLPIYVSLEKIDRRLVEAAKDLYAGPARAFQRITLPLALPGVFAGSLLVFIPAMGDFVNAELLGSVQTRLIGNVIQSRFLVNNDYPTAAALSFMLMAGILAAVFIYARVLGTDELETGIG
ncbi:MAG: ABC transporter permease [Candidatus Aquidulcis sp.]|nr:MAG: ABC transporter permease [Candidatus Aquidulcis sp.]RLT49407.1 MAG: ABC transporter permease [Candidatus Aquidulcis sp.]RLT58692.1 MAG: ABC transporter permease [Candidatus Aquidulcis sp.]